MRRTPPTKSKLDYVTPGAVGSGWSAISSLWASPSWLEKALALFVGAILFCVGLLLLPYALIYDTWLVFSRAAEAFEAPPQRSSRVRATRSPARPSATPAAPGLRCAFCHEGFASENTQTCEECGTMLHTSCAGELGGCPTLGCSKAQARRERT